MSRPAGPAAKFSDFRNLDAEELNGGVPPEAMAGISRTPLDRLFTRSHAPPPIIDPETWRLTVSGLAGREHTFSLADVMQMPSRDVTMTMVCAGFRRQELLTVAPLSGELPWGLEPVGTSTWTGVSLREVLERAGIGAEARHVEAIGGDAVTRDGSTFGFGASLPLAKAMERDVLLAWELDGCPIPRAHGFPVRLVVPGWIGARSVKWLTRLVLRRDPSPNYFQTRAYRIQRAMNPDDPRDVSAGTVIEAVGLNSVITSPADGASLGSGSVRVTGWALGPNAEPVSRVELSDDGGATWIPATLAASGDRWTWRLWNARITLPPGSHELVVRAWDQAGRCQPESVRETWNAKGYDNNAWHRVRVQVEGAVRAS